MTTRLYISDRFITSIDELKVIVEEVGSTPSTPVALQLIAAACDGVLENWLQNASNNNEREISMLKEHLVTLGDNERWRFIKQNLTGKIDDSQWNWREKTEIEGPEEDFWYGLENGETVHLKFSFHCKGVMDEQIELRILDQRRTLDMNKTTQEIIFDVDGSKFKGKVLELFKHGDLNPIWCSEREQFNHKLIVFSDRSYDSDVSLNGIDVCDLNGVSLTKEKLLYLSSYKEWICATNQSKTKLYLILSSKICNIGDYDVTNSVSPISSGEGLMISSNEGKILSIFFISNNSSIPEFDYLLDYAKKRNLAYFTLISDESKTITVNDKKSISFPNFEIVINIGNLSGEELFWAKHRRWDDNKNAIIINEKGDYVRDYGYNGSFLPIGDNKYIATNGGNRYWRFIVYRLDGQIIGNYRIEGRLSGLYYENDNETSYIINEGIRYIKNKNQLISYIRINHFFYIKSGYYVENDYNKRDCEHELYSSTTDTPLFLLENDINLSLINGCIVVKKKHEKNYIVVSPQGHIVYTLKEGETIYGDTLNENYSFINGFSKYIKEILQTGLSTKHIIVKAIDNSIKIYTLSGECACSIKTQQNEEIIGFENNKLFVIRNGEVSYYNTNGEKQKIIYDKNVQKGHIGILPNGNLLIKSYKKDALGLVSIYSGSSYILINPSGKVLLEKADIRYL